MKVRFSDVVFDSEARAIMRSGELLHLSPKAFDLLALLIEARPRVVRKQEIVDTLWPDVVVEEANVRNLIAEVRGAIGDEHVRTLPRVGYAFRGDPSPAPLTCGLASPDREFTLATGENLIGRGDDCAVVIRASGVSRNHAKITISSRGEALLQDLGSKNGTYVGERRVSDPLPLHDGDRIRVGAAVLVFFSHPAAMSTTTLAGTGR